MSMAVLEKGGKPAATRKDGIRPISWSSGFLRSFLQVFICRQPMSAKNGLTYALFLDELFHVT